MVQLAPNSNWAVEESPSEQDIRFLRKQLQAHNIAQAHIDEGVQLTSEKAAGLQLERVCQLWIAYSSFSHTNSGYMAVGIESFPDFLAKTLDGLSSGFDYTVEEFDMCNVRTEFQRSKPENARSRAQQ